MAADLTLEAVSVRYRRADRDALHQISTCFAAGTCTAVVGPTGAGKSTLLQALTGVVPALSGGTRTGRIRYGEADLADYRVQTITEYIGLVLQDPASQLIGRSVAEDVGFGPRNQLLARDQIAGRVSAALDQVGLPGFEDRLTADLSGGELQRLAIAGVLARSPEILCLDEATAELDPGGAQAVRGVLDRLLASGVGVVLSSHDPAEIIGRADQLIALAAGELAWQGRPGDFFADLGLIRRLGVRPASVTLLAEAVLTGLGEDAGSQPLPVTVDQAEDWLRGLFGPRLVNPVAPPIPVPPARRISPDVLGQPAVEIEGLRFSYPGRPAALRGVDLQIGAGEFVALAGPNGAGKTTLVKHLIGLLRPDAGRVRLFGREIADQQIWQLAGEVGFVFQNPDHQLFNTTVSAEVGFGLRTAGMAAAEVRRRVAAALEITGLAGLAGQHPLTLARGQRQLVAVASALVGEPRLLVIDEPTTGLDWAGAQAVMSLVDRLHQQGTTILMISHDQDLIARHAERVITLGHGQVVADGPTALAVQTDITRLWRRLFGPVAVPILDASQAGAAIAGLLQESR